jgi:transcriptional regulator NrdR family protein
MGGRNPSLGPACPNCGHPITGVITTARSGDGGFYRRRHCQQCDHRFHTAQLAEVIVPTNVFLWTGRHLQINWQHSDLLSRMRELISLPRR